MNSNDEMRIFKTNTDVAGNNHYKYAQYYKGVRVEGIEHIVHERSRKVHLANGDFIADLDLIASPSITPAHAIETVLIAVPAKSYLLEDAQAEADYKKKRTTMQHFIPLRNY